MLLIIAQLAAAAAPGPSFDCARAQGSVEQAICAEADLAALDREEARLYRLALDARPGERRRPTMRQREFLRSRDACGREADVVAECVRNAYQQDIAELRRSEGLAGDAGGLSSGPVRYRCDGGFPEVWVTRFRLNPAQAWDSVPAREEGQPLVAGDSGALAGRYDRGQVLEADGRLRLNARICLPVE